MLLIVLAIIPLVKLLEVTKNPLLCAGIFTGFMGIIQFIAEVPLEGILVSITIKGVLSFAYFYLLNMTSSFVWWAIFLIGAGIILYV
jgi:hypothetical protein